MSVVIVELDGGLGNQMFQYAVGRRLAKVNKSGLRLDLGARYGGASLRDYGLDAFRIQTPPERTGWLARLRPAPPAEPIWLRERKAYDAAELAAHLAADPEAATARRLLFDESLLTAGGNCRLTGYWQDERYFADIAGLIRREFTLRAGLDERSMAMLRRIMAAPSAFIHIRRTDYLSHNYNGFFGTCEPDYYRAGLAILRERHGNALNIFAFSDEPDWVRAQFPDIAGLQVIDWNGAQPAHDLMLMRSCDHAIIANSSFSWWGAWLGEKPGNSIIAPRLWFAGRPDFTEIVPTRWQVLG
jgi:hypothetical protein